MAKREELKFSFSARPKKRVKNKSYLGQKDDQHSSVIGNFKAEIADNCDFEVNKEQGRVTLKKRKGYAALGNSAVGVEENLGLGDYHYFASGTDTETLMASFNSGSSSIVFNYSADGSWLEQAGASAMTQDKHVVYQNANNSMYLYNGSDSVRKYNNTTWTALSTGVPVSGVGEIGKYAVWHKSMNFVAGMTTYPSRVYISALADPEDFTSADYITVNPEDGNIITGLGSLQDFVVVFKSQGIYLISGDSPTTASLTQRSKDIGCLSHFSIAEGKSASGQPVVYFLGNGIDGAPAIYMFDSVTVKRISDDIQTELEELNVQQLSKAAGIWDINKYKVSIPDGAATTNDKELVYYPDIDQWVVNTGKRPGHYIVYEGGNDIGNTFFADSNNSGLVYQDNSGVVDQDTLISFTWQGRSEDDGEPYMDKKWKKMWITTNTIGDTQMSAFASVDEANFIYIGALSLSSSTQWGDSGITWGDGVTIWGGASDISKHRLSLDVNRGKNLKLKYQSEQSAGQEKVYEHSLFYKAKKIK